MTYPVNQRFFGVKLPLPIFRIDYIFYRGGMRPVSVRNGRMPGSDHRYVVAEFDSTAKSVAMADAESGQRSPNVDSEIQDPVA